jgi:hypothetical protein
MCSLRMDTQSGTIISVPVAHNTGVRLWTATCNARVAMLALRSKRISTYVFSSTLKKADWSNSSVVIGDVPAEAANLRELPKREVTFVTGN